jgi:hypothetical protein
MLAIALFSRGPQKEGPVATDVRDDDGIGARCHSESVKRGSDRVQKVQASDKAAGGACWIPTNLGCDFLGKLSRG